MKTNGLLKILGIPVLSLLLTGGIRCSNDDSNSPNPNNPAPTNNKPVIKIINPIETREGGDCTNLNQYLIDGTITDPDGDPIALSAELCDSKGDNCTVIPNNYQTSIDNNTTDDVYKIKLIADDGRGGITESIIDLDVKDIYGPLTTTKKTLASGLEAVVLKKGIEVKTGRKSNSAIALDSNGEPVISYFSANTVTGEKSIEIIKQQNGIYGKTKIPVMWNPEGYLSMKVVPNIVDNRDDIHMAFTTSTDNGQNLSYFNDKKNPNYDLGEVIPIKTNNTGLENAIAIGDDDSVNMVYNYKNNGIGRLGYSENSTGNFVPQDLGDSSGQVSITTDGTYFHIANGFDVEVDHHTTEPAGINGCIDDATDNFNPVIYRDSTNTYSKIAAQGYNSIKIYSNQSGSWTLESEIASTNPINRDSKFSGTTDANGNFYGAYIVNNATTSKRELWVATDLNGGNSIKIGDNYANPAIAIGSDGKLHVTATYAEGTGSNTANNSLEYIIAPSLFNLN